MLVVYRCLAKLLNFILSDWNTPPHALNVTAQTATVIRFINICARVMMQFGEELRTGNFGLVTEVDALDLTSTPLHQTAKNVFPNVMTPQLAWRYKLAYEIVRVIDVLVAPLKTDSQYLSKERLKTAADDRGLMVWESQHYATIIKYANLLTEFTTSIKPLSVDTMPVYKTDTIPPQSISYAFAVAATLLSAIPGLPPPAESDRSIKLYFGEVLLGYIADMIFRLSTASTRLASASLTSRTTAEQRAKRTLQGEDEPEIEFADEQPRRRQRQPEEDSAQKQAHVETELFDVVEHGVRTSTATALNYNHAIDIISMKIRANERLLRVARDDKARGFPGSEDRIEMAEAYVAAFNTAKDYIMRNRDDYKLKNFALPKLDIQPKDPTPATATAAAAAAAATGSLSYDDATSMAQDSQSVPNDVYKHSISALVPSMSPYPASPKFDATWLDSEEIRKRREAMSPVV